MKYIISSYIFRGFLILLFLGVFFYDLSAQDFSLKSYAWRKRILVVFAVDAQDERYKQQILAAKEGEKGFKDRDLVVISIFKNSGLDEKKNTIREDAVRSIRKKYGISNSEFKVILIGKDGGAKKSAIQPFNQQALFNMIDAMPMRQDEIKN
jgi:hypothetical protein